MIEKGNIKERWTESIKLYKGDPGMHILKVRLEVNSDITEGCFSEVVGKETRTQEVKEIGSRKVYKMGINSPSKKLGCSHAKYEQ